MTRAYIRLDPGFFERKVIDQGYSGGELTALVGALCLAEQQNPRGRFRNERVLRALLGEFGRHVPALVKRKDLTADEFGRLYLDGWDEWQEGDVTVRERMSRIRNRKPRDGSDRNTGDVPASNSPVSSVAMSNEPHSAAEQSRAPDETEDDAWRADEAEAVDWLRRHKCVIREGDGFHQRLITAVERHGVNAIVGQFDRLARVGTQDGDIKGFLFRAIDLLDARGRPNLKELEAEERREELDEDFGRRAARTLEENRRRFPNLYPEGGAA